jgi:hypothetical protein
MGKIKKLKRWWKTENRISAYFYQRFNFIFILDMCLIMLFPIYMYTAIYMHTASNLLSTMIIIVLGFYLIFERYYLEHEARKCIKEE